MDDNDDMSEIIQLDGCDSVSASSTNSHSDTSSIAPDNSFVSQTSALSQDAKGSCEQLIGAVNGVTTHQWDCTPPVWYEQHHRWPASLPMSRQSGRRDNILLVGSKLPSFSSPNCGSLAPKLRNFAADKKMRLIGDHFA